VRRPIEDIAHRPALDDPSGIHHGYLVADARHDAEVVRDEEHSHVRFGLDLLQQLKVLELNGDV
jgi:hypothetical protein